MLNAFNFLFQTLTKMSNLVLILGGGGGTEVRDGEFQLGREKSPFPRVLYEILCIVAECHINEYVYLCFLYSTYNTYIHVLYDIIYTYIQTPYREVVAHTYIYTCTTISSRVSPYVCVYNV